MDGYVRGNRIPVSPIVIKQSNRPIPQAIKKKVNKMDVQKHIVIDGVDIHLSGKEAILLCKFFGYLDKKTVNSLTNDDSANDMYTVTDDLFKKLYGMVGNTIDGK